MPTTTKYDPMKLKGLSREIEDLKEQYEREHGQLVALTKRALRARMPQAEVVRLTGLSKMTVAKIAKTIETTYDPTELIEQAKVRAELFQRMRKKQEERRALILAGREAGETKYALAKVAGVSETNITRLVKGEGES